MGRLVVLDPDVCKNSEPEDQEYKYCIFKGLPKVCTVQKVTQAANMTVNVVTHLL